MQLNGAAVHLNSAAPFLSPASPITERQHRHSWCLSEALQAHPVSPMVPVAFIPVLSPLCPQSTEQVAAFCRSLHDMKAGCECSSAPQDCAGPQLSTPRQLTDADKLRKVICELLETERTYVKVRAEQSWANAALPCLNGVKFAYSVLCGKRERSQLSPASFATSGNIQRRAEGPTWQSFSEFLGLKLSDGEIPEASTERNFPHTR